MKVRDTVVEERPHRTLWLLLLSIRPKQWAKNLVVFFAFFFSISERTATSVPEQFSLFGRVALAFVLFCLLSGAIYLVNDLVDMESDKLHPKKRFRPLASGAFSPSMAVFAAVLLAAIALSSAFLLDVGFGVAAAVYFVMMIAYSLVLKNVVILDIMTVSAGFVLRAAAGAVVLNVPISPWLYIVTSLGALLISLGKRRNELTIMGVDGANHRESLREYTPALVDQLIAVVAPATVVAYTLYTFTAKNLPSDNAMMLTIPFVLYGIFRYLYLVHKRNLGGSPEEVFLTDKPLLVDILLWLAAGSVILVVFK